MKFTASLFFFAIFIFVPNATSAATGDIQAVRILGDATHNGWVAEVDIEGFTSTSTTNDFGLGVNNDPQNAKVVFSVTSPGYDSNGSPVNVVRTIYGTKIVRLPYPNQNSLNISTSTGIATLKVALSDFIYDDEDVEVSMASGWYTDNGPGGTGLPTNVASDISVTNNSVLAYPKSIGRWAWPGYERVVDDFLVEAVVFNRFAKDSKPLAAMVFTASDESGNTVYATTTDMTKTTRTGDANIIQVYAATIPVDSLTQGDIITVNFKAYPWVGTSTAILNSDLVANGGDGYAQPDERLGPLHQLLDKTGEYGVSFAVVDPASTAANAAVYATQSAAESAYSGNNNTAYATIKAASDAIKSYNNTNYGRDDAGAGTILLSAANHEMLGAAALTMGTMNTWLTITKLSTITEAEAVINANTSNRRWNAQKLKFRDITLSGLVGLLVYGNNGNSNVLWLDSNTINISASAGIVDWRVSYATQNTVSALPLGFKHSGTTKNPYVIVRGNTGPAASFITSASFNVLGNSQIMPNVNYETGNLQNTQITTNAIIAFNTIYNLNSAVTPVNFSSSPSTTNIEDIAVIQNIFENRVTTAPLIALAAGSQQLHPSRNILVWHNTLAGSRFNNAYNGYGSSSVSHTLYSEIGNQFDNWNQHENDHDTTFDVADAGRKGGWSIEYAVGLIANMMRTSSVSTDFFHGLNTSYGGTLGYVLDKSSTGDAAGNGNYHLTSSSSALNIIPSGKAVLPYDLDGNARRNDGTGSAGAYEYIEASTVTTQSASSITQTTATLNGNITSTGGANVTTRGFAYGTSATLATTIATTSSSGSFGTGAFTYDVTSLTCNTTYYFRPYATNPIGTSYGTIVSFTTSACVSIPTITTDAASSITTTTTTLNGSISDTGGANATESGFAYGTSADLSTVIATTTLGAQTGTASFNSSVSSLTCNTTYYARAYATNSAGTGYGSIVSFTTSSCVTVDNTPAPSRGSSSGSSAARRAINISQMIPNTSTNTSSGIISRTTPTLSQFIEILIVAGIIPQDRADQARIAASSASTAVSSFTRDLQLHDSGSDVSSLQEFLISKGHLSSGSAIGIFGPLTLNALKSYQASVGLPVTGYFGPLTRASMQR